MRLKKPSSSSPFFIVGVGASAGGLEALKQFLSALPTETGMAFVLVQHLDPTHESLSADILSRMTQMPVAEITNGVQVEPNHVYVIPPNCSIGILHGALNLLPRHEARGQQTVIDFFFRSLAKDQKNFAVGAVFSGTGSDGTTGLMNIKEEGGITFAQAPNTAKFNDMPKSAIASGAVDFALSPQRIAEELVKIAQHRIMAPSKSQATLNTEGDQGVFPQDRLSKIFLLLRNICHVDFTYYKLNTIQRRLERRMTLCKMESLDAYVQYISENPDEVRALYADILIHVTSFFRDPEAYEAIRHEVFPKLIQDHSSGLPIRIWVPGCSTGEEVYSIAILLLEYLGDRITSIPVQIFASDISEQAIQKARVGEYPESISHNLSPERLNRFFLKTDHGYKVSKSVRDVCLFSRHDLAVDPPFAKIDLISCRNLLIYFTSALQKHIIPIFHYSLGAKGYLWLGKSETLGESSALFTLVDKVNKLYLRKNAPVTLNLRFPSSTYVPGKQEVIRKPPTFAKVGVDVQKLTDLALQSEYPGVLVNEEMEILQFRGRTVPFIEPSAGIASYHLLRMARQDFVPDLRALIQAAKKSKFPVRKESLHFKEGHRILTFNLKVIPVKPSSVSKEYYYFILFENAVETDESKRKGAHRGKKVKDSKKKPGSQRMAYVAELQQELLASQEYQHDLVEKYENTQEDLTTANEELQSTNEELQSSNEELETVKEELQSSNEELTTVNDELQIRSVEQIQLSNDLLNLLGSVEIPILMLGNDHRIRRFTPMAAKALNLIATDVGRPISDLKLNFTSPGIELDLELLVSEVIDTMKAKEVEVQDRKNRWFRLQVKPYKTADHKIDGAVLALVDIDALKQSLSEVRLARAEAERANRSKDLFLTMLSHELRTPLTSILAWAQMLRRGKLDAEKTKKGIAFIEESGKAQAQIINDLLDVSRIIAGKFTLELREVNPVTVVRSAIEAVRSTAESKSIQIETAFDSEVGTVMADSARLQQVFWNLLTNSIQFSEPGSKITVLLEGFSRQRGDRSQVMVQVRDSGRGVDPEFLPLLFDRFGQDSDANRRFHRGLGLGFTIVKNLVELHRGVIRAESAGENRGTTFTVLLPIKSGRSLPELPVKIGDQLPDEGLLEGLRVLIVDDQFNTREALTEVLRSFGAEVLSTSSTTEALALIQQLRPDVFLSDIAMPREDGFSLIRRLRALSPKLGGWTPAIALTAYTGDEDVEECLAAGFQLHLVKPIDSRCLAEAVARLASRKVIKS